MRHAFNHDQLIFFVLINIFEINNFLSHSMCTKQFMLFDLVTSLLF